MTTLYDLSGGRERLHEMTAAFYAKVIEDDLLGPMFKRGAADEVAMPADFIYHFARYVDAISRSVRDQSNMRREDLAAMLGVPPETGLDR